MNVCIFMGRATKDVEISTSGAGNVYGRTSIAVDTGWGDNKNTSFFDITAFGKTAESMEKYVRKGTKIVVRAEARQNSYKDKDGNNRTSVSFIVNNWEFAESKAVAEQNRDENASVPTAKDDEGFMTIPEGIEDEMLPF